MTSALLRYSRCASAGLVVLGALLAGCSRSVAPLPGVVVDHKPAGGALYIGSPSLVILDDGSYLASHDDFGAASDLATVSLFRSGDRGAHWAPLATVAGQYWSTLFQHRGALYLFGTSKEFGDLVIRRSTDNGLTWTVPRDGRSGLLRSGAPYHTAPLPFVARDGRLWRAIEVRRDARLAIQLLSVPDNADLLEVANWTFSNEVAWQAAYDPVARTTGGWPWEETNVVSDGGGIFRLIARLNNASDGLAPELTIDSPGHVRPEPRLVNLPGAAKKFEIRYDPVSGRFWALTNPALADRDTLARRGPSAVRNTLTLVSSADGVDWCIDRTVQHHGDVERHGFHYADWQFDGDDIVYVTRTAFDDGSGGAHSAHDANFMMFGRIDRFREHGCGSPARLKPDASL